MYLQPFNYNTHGEQTLLSNSFDFGALIYVAFPEVPSEQLCASGEEEEKEEEEEEVGMERRLKAHAAGREGSENKGRQSTATNMLRSPMVPILLQQYAGNLPRLLFACNVSVYLSVLVRDAELSLFPRGLCAVVV